MRQVFSSPRIENIDRVEGLLHDIGIETYVTHRDKLRRNHLRRFSYSSGGANESAWPAIWIKRAEDLPRARQLLRDAGLMGSTRPNVATQYQPYSPTYRKPHRAATQTRRILLILVMISALYMFWNMNQQRKPATAVSPETVLPLPDDQANEHETLVIIDETNIEPE